MTFGLNAMENVKIVSCEPVVYIKEEHTNISALNPIDLNIQDEEEEIGDKSEHKVYCSLTVVNPEEITYDSLGSEDYNSDWVFGLQTSDGSLNQQMTVKNTESSQQSVIECDLSNDSTYSRLNDNSSSDNSNMYTYYSLPNDSSLVSFSHQEAAIKRVDFNDWNNKNVPEQKKGMTKAVSKVIAKVEKSPPVKKTFACPICCKIFASKSNLERHGIVHSDVKPFQCVECKRMFSRRVHLERHKFLHMDQKPFNCEVCKKGFTQKTHLLKHQYVHTGVKPFPCPFCEKSFARKESFNRHKAIHAANEQANVDNKNNVIEKKNIVNLNGGEKKEINRNLVNSSNKANNLVDVHRVKSKVKNEKKNIIVNTDKEKLDRIKLNEKTVITLKKEINIKEEIKIINENEQINANEKKVLMSVGKEEVDIKKEKKATVEEMDIIECEEKSE